MPNFYKSVLKSIFRLYYYFHNQLDIDLHVPM